MTTLSPLKLTSSSELDRESENIPYLTERMLIDLVNGVEVIGEQLCFRKSSTLFSRLLASFDGTQQLRQQLIDEHLNNSVKALAGLAKRLCERGKFTDQALRLVTDRLRDTRKLLEQVTDFSIETREQVRVLETRIVQMSREVNERIETLELQTRANNRIEEVIAAWHAGRHYVGYPPLIQAALVFEDLARGAEGRYILGEENYRRRVVDRASTILKDLTGLRSFDFYPLEEWIKAFASSVSNSEPTKRLLVAYLISSGSQRPLHSLLSEYVETEVIPGWAREKQANGEMSVILGTTLLLEQYSLEFNLAAQAA